MKIETAKVTLQLVAGRRIVDLYVNRVDTKRKWLWTVGRTFHVDEDENFRVAKAGTCANYRDAFRSAMRAAERLIRAKNFTSAERLKP